jgi:FAD:protein FMN transferase
MNEHTLPVPWLAVSTGDTTVGVAERAALGTTARVAVWPSENLQPAVTAVDVVLAALDRQASRFRSDSEISWVHRKDGGMFLLSNGLAEAVGVALAAARWTRGMTDPTVGEALISLGYDRDFAMIESDDRPPVGAATPPAPVPGWREVHLDGPVLRMPSGLRLDLGATAKGLGSDRAVRAAMVANCHHGGVLVGLGGDIAVDGEPPRGGWPILVADHPEPSGEARTQEVRLVCGAVATSSTSCRQWRRAGRSLHHIVDPRTGRPTTGPWRTVSVAAATCADANAAATAAVVAGDRAVAWLEEARVPARLVADNDDVVFVGGWPEGDGEPLEPRTRGHVYEGAGPR